MIAGTTVRCSVKFQDSNGADVDPTSVIFKYRPPSGVIVSYTYPSASEVIKDSVGDYHSDVLANSAGNWDWKWEGTGSVVAVSEGSFTVSESKF